jgi:hypothetical protein
MQRVPLDMLKPGMVCAKAVVNDKGMTLCAEGTELSAAMIERLKRMGISSLVVKGTPIDTGVPPKTKEELLAEMQARFVPTAGDAIMDRLKESIGKAILSAQTEEEEGSISDE